MTLTYDYDAHRLTSLSVDSRTFYYGYTTNNGDNYLTSFTPPVGNPWIYDYEPDYHTRELNLITFPTGGQISYAYNDVVFATGVANVSFRVVTGRSTSGRGITDGTWTYAYESYNSGGLPNKTTITAPGVTENHTFYGWGNTGSGNVWKVGLPMSKSYSGNMTLSEVYGWDQRTLISDNDIGNADWGGMGGYISAPINSKIRQGKRDRFKFTGRYFMRRNL